MSHIIWSLMLYNYNALSMINMYYATNFTNFIICQNMSIILSVSWRLTVYIIGEYKHYALVLLERGTVQHLCCFSNISVCKLETRHIWYSFCTGICVQGSKEIRWIITFSSKEYSFWSIYVHSSRYLDSQLNKSPKWPIPEQITNNIPPYKTYQCIHSYFKAEMYFPCIQH